MCTQQGRRRTGPFALPEGDPVQGADAPDPRAAGAPFTSMELEKELEGDLRGTNHRDKTNFLRGGLPPEGSRTVVRSVLVLAQPTATPAPPGPACVALRATPTVVGIL